MDWQILLLIVSFILFGLLLIGEWIVFALGIAGTIFLYIVGGLPALRPIGGIVWENASNVTLSAIPLFILMGQLILQSKCGERFYHGMSMIFGRVPGGLLHTNIISCGIFAALSGVSVATAATIGTIAIPELTKRGYDRKMNFGSLVAGGTLGVLIPPAVPLILYGVLTQQSVTKLFAAGILPGIMMMLLFTAYICVRVFFNPKLAGVPLATDLARFSLSAFFVSVFPVVGLILVCMGGIYLGFMTPTEAGAVGAVLAMGIFLWFKGFDTQALKTVFRQTIRSSVMILFIAVGAQIFSFSMAYGDLNQMMAGWVVSKATSPAIMFALMIGIFIILGCFLDPIAINVLAAGVLCPIAVQFGFSPIWFGIVMAMMIELGLIHPPVGLNLFIIHGLSDRPMKEVILGALPYCFITLIGLLLIYIFPDIVLFLPNSMR